MTKILTILGKRAIVALTSRNFTGYLMFGALFINFTTAITPTALAESKITPSYSLLALETAQNPDILASQIASNGNSITTQNDIFIQAPNQGAFEIPITRLDVMQKNAVKSRIPLEAPSLTGRTKLIAVGAVKERRIVTVTAYSSTPDQTDDSPFITANGAYVYDGLIAANFLPFGAKVRFPDYFGDKVFTVEDRMAKRFSNRADVWMETREAALQFGVRKLAIEILE